MASKKFNFEKTFQEIKKVVAERQKVNGVVDSFGEAGKDAYLCGLSDGIFQTYHETYKVVINRLIDVMKNNPGISLEDTLSSKF